MSSKLVRSTCARSVSHTYAVHAETERMRNVRVVFVEFIRFMFNRVTGKQLGIISKKFFVTGEISERSLVACEVALPRVLSCSVPVCDVGMCKRVASPSSSVSWNPHNIL